MKRSRNAVTLVVESALVGMALWASVGMLPAAMAADTKLTAEVATQGPVKVEGAWIRATVKGQQGTGGFMDITAPKAMTLLGFETPAAKHAELHEMAMDGNVMRMRAVTALPLPAGTTVSFKPGSYHLMLTDLPRPLSNGDSVPLTLLLKAEDGKTMRQTISVPVKAPQMAHPHEMHSDH